MRTDESFKNAVGEMKTAFRLPSFLRVALKPFGSMFFAIALILTLAVFMALATFWGMQFGDAASSWGVYHANWFLFLCFLLALSVLASALLRFPWRKYQTGFLVTHLGILVLLVGCWVDFRRSQSAYLSIAEGKSNSVAVCPGEVHFDLRLTSAEGESFRKSIRFTPGLFSWRFYGTDWFSWGVKESLPRLPWGLPKFMLYRNGAGDVLFEDESRHCRLEVLDYLRAGELKRVKGTPASAESQTLAEDLPEPAEKFAWEVAHAGGNPGKSALSRMEMKQKLASWPSWVKVRLTADGESREFWLRQFDYFTPDGLEKNVPDTSEKTLFRMTTAKGSEAQLIFAQNTVDLNFALRLDRFNNQLDPGTSMAAHYSSDATLVDKKDPERVLASDLKIMMNQPVDIFEPGTKQVWRLFQTSFSGPFLNREAAADEKDQFYVSTFTVHYSPGRGLLYLGCLLVALGIGIMFSMKAYFFKKPS